MTCAEHPQAIFRKLAFVDEWVVPEHPSTSVTKIVTYAQDVSASLCSEVRKSMALSFFRHSELTPVAGKRFGILLGANCRIDQILKHLPAVVKMTKAGVQDDDFSSVLSDFKNPRFGNRWLCAKGGFPGEFNFGATQPAY